MLPVFISQDFDYVGFKKMSVKILNLLSFSMYKKELQIKCKYTVVFLINKDFMAFLLKNFIKDL